MVRDVYLIGSPASPLVKIGLSGTPGLRLREIQRMSPVPLVLLDTFEGGGSLESALHRYFADRRQYGEWFDIPDPVNAVKAALADPELHNPAPRELVELVVTIESPNWPLPRQNPGSSHGGSWKRPRRLGQEASRVYRDLLRRIQEGEFPTDSKLPSPSELGVHYGVATITAVQAVMHLDLDGIVTWVRYEGATVR